MYELELDMTPFLWSVLSFGSSYKLTDLPNSPDKSVHPFFDTSATW